jgi:hypothetical protein
MWNAFWDDWFMISSGWLLGAGVAGMMLGAFLAQLQHEREGRRETESRLNNGAKLSGR